ncbi:MAG: phosphoglycerate kinase, partial [Candidatus Bathyarchaeota archaeon]
MLTKFSGKGLFLRVISVVVIASFVLSNITVSYARADSLRPRNAGARGADRGFITEMDHSRMREFLKRIDAYNSLYTKHTFPIEGIGIVRIQAVPGMAKETGYIDHYAIRPVEGAHYLYFDKATYEGEYGYRLEQHGLYEFEAIMRFAHTQGWNEQELVNWLDSEGDPDEVLALLKQIHDQAPALPEEMRKAEFYPSYVGPLITTYQKTVQGLIPTLDIYMYGLYGLPVVTMNELQHKYRQGYARLLGLVNNLTSVNFSEDYLLGIINEAMRIITSNTREYKEAPQRRHANEIDAADWITTFHVGIASGTIEATLRFINQLDFVLTSATRERIKATLGSIENDKYKKVLLTSLNDLENKQLRLLNSPSWRPVRGAAEAATQLPRDFLTLDDVGDLTGKPPVLIRIDANTSVRDGRIGPSDRIVESAPTVRELADRGARVVVIAHQGRRGDADYLESMEQHAALLSQHVGRPIRYVHDLYGEEAVKAILGLKDGEILMLKNVRPGEDDPRFVEILEPLFYAFVNDAFSVSHRAQKSVVGFIGIPNVAGRLMQRELEGNGRFLTAVQHPYIEVLGGSKISDHLDALEFGLRSGLIDRVLTGGLLGQLLLLIEGHKLGEPTERVLREQDVDRTRPEGLLTQSFLDRLKAIYEQYKDKFVLPVDLAYVDGQGLRQEILVSELPAEGIPFLIADNGTQTAEKYTQMLREAKTVFVKGPQGDYRKEQFRQSSETVLAAVAKSGAMWMTGGGDTDSLIQRLGLTPTHRTLAGGAFL